MRKGINLKEILTNLEIAFWNNLIRLMGNRRQVRAAISLIVVVVLIIVGLLASLTLDYFLPYRNDVRAGVDKFASLGSNIGFYQRNTLVIVVDQLALPRLLYQPELRGVWLVASLPTTPRLTLLPLYPHSLSGGLEADIQLVDKFSLERKNVPADEFMAFLQAKDIYWENYLLIDEAGLLKLVELAGGAFFEPFGLVDDLDLVNQLTMESQQPHGHAALAGAICSSSWDLFEYADPDQVAKDLAGHLYSDPDPYLLITTWYQMYKNGASFSCEFPTLSRGGALPENRP